MQLLLSAFSLSEIQKSKRHLLPILPVPSRISIYACVLKWNKPLLVNISSTFYFFEFSPHNLFPVQFRIGNCFMKNGSPRGVLSHNWACSSRACHHWAGVAMVSAVFPHSLGQWNGSGGCPIVASSPLRTWNHTIFTIVFQPQLPIKYQFLLLPCILTRSWALQTVSSWLKGRLHHRVVLWLPLNGIILWAATTSHLFNHFYHYPILTSILTFFCGSFTSSTSCSFSPSIYFNTPI